MKKNADHKVLSEGCESRHNHRYAVVVQDLATQQIQCVGEVIVQGDEGPVGGVAQGVHYHGVIVRHEEKEEEEIEQEVEGEKEEKRSNNNAHVHGWDDYGRQVRAALSQSEM